MNLDHSDFIARHAHIKPDAELGKTRLRRIVLSLCFLVAYVLGCVVIAVIFNIDNTVMLAASVTFIVAAVFAFLFQKFIHNYKRQEKERALIRQVFEGSRGARLITDASDYAVYTNKRFDDLFLQNETPLSAIDTLAALFSDNKEALNHFKNLAEQAGRGLHDSIELKSIKDGREKWFTVAAQPVAG